MFELARRSAHDTARHARNVMLVVSWSDTTSGIWAYTLLKHLAY